MNVPVATPVGRRLTLTRDRRPVARLVYSEAAGRLFFPADAPAPLPVLEWVKGCVGPLLKKLAGCKLENVEFTDPCGGGYGFRFDAPAATPNHLHEDV